MKRRSLGGSVALVTGCASGIARALVGALVRAGASVVATDVDAAGLDRAAREESWPAGSVTTRPLDVRREDDWEEAFEHAEATFGPVDLCVHAAAVLRPGRVHELPSADIDFHVDVNVKGTIVGTRVAARRMVPRGKGHIVNFGSLASLAPVPGLTLYAATKFAVRGFSLAAAADLAPHGVAVTVIMPDAVATPMLDLQVGYEEAAMTFSGSRPLTKEEVVEAVLEAIDTRPLELSLPKGRAALARISTVAPASSMRLMPLLERIGKRKQSKLRGGG